MRKTILYVALVAGLLLSACGALPSAVSSMGSNQPANAAPAGNQSVNSSAAAKQPAQQAQPPVSNQSQRSISVNGNGQVSLAPEMAYVTIGVHSQSDSIANSLQDNNTKSQAVTKALKDMGIDEKDIQTTSFNIYPQQQFDQNGEVKSTTYVVDNSVFVTVRKLQSLGQVLDTSVKAGANSINGISFDVAEKTKNQAISDARKLAVDSARAQADALAQAAGVGVGDLLNIASNLSSGPIPMLQAAGKGGVMSAADTTQIPVSAGQITIHVDVTATYSIK